MVVTRSRAGRRVAALAAVPALLAVSAATAPAPAPLAPGLTYSFRMTSQMTEADGKPKELSSMTGRGQVSGSSARFEVVSTKGAQGQQGAFGGKGSYMLFTEGGKTMTIVDPENKQYYEMDLAGMMRMMSAMGPIMKIEMTDVSFEPSALGAGETIEGYATQKHQLVSKYTTKVSIMGMKQTSTSTDTATYWYAPQLKLIGSPFANAPGIGQLVNNPDYDEKLRAAMAKMPSGVPVKIVSRSVSMDGKGKQTSTLTTIEYTEIKRGDVPASAFEIPAGFAKVQSPTLTAEQMDSLEKASAAAEGQRGEQGVADPTGVTDAAKQGAKEGAQEAAKEGAKATAKKKIGRIFGRP